MLTCKNCGAALDSTCKFCRQCGFPVILDAPPIPMPISVPIPSEKVKPAVDRRDAVFVLLSFVIGFAFCEFILFGGLGLAVPAFYIVFYLCAGIYLSRSHRIFNTLSVLTFIPLILLLACFAFYDNMALRAVNVLALWVFTALNLAAMTGNSPVLWVGSLYDVLKVTLILPFHHFNKGATALGSLGKKGGNHGFVKVIITLLVISPIVFIVLGLLASSDAGFEKLLSDMTSLLTADIWQYFMKTVLAVMLLFPIFSLLYSLRYDKRPGKHPFEGIMLRLGALDTLITVAAMSVFSLIYVLYIALQADYFFSALRGVLPGGFTYAEYARRGFFELVAVVFINFCLISIAIALTKRKNGRPPKGCLYSVLTLATLTLLLIVTAASKMAIYVGNYGLTPLRVYTSFFMLILGLVTIFMMIKVAVPRFNFYRAAVVTTITLYLALNFINVDGIIAGYNINLYTQGYSDKLDTTLFDELSDSAIPQIATLKNDPTYGSEVRQLLSDRKLEISGTQWQNESLAKQIALNAIDDK